jgi:UDP-glucose 4-epimerase
VKVGVTGANGFLGRHVVTALRRSGHEVRALIRPSASIGDLGWDAGVEVWRVDLRTSPDLADSLADLAALVHLAATMSGSDFLRFSATVVGTERLLEAVAQSDVKRVILCSSFSVYDWTRASGTVDESLPLLEGPDVYSRGGYATAKIWQERLARQMAAAHAWELTVLRPGFVWGPGNECPRGSLGIRIGSAHLVFSGGRQLPFTYVENAADCVRVALEEPAAAGETLNVVDGFDLSAWRFAGEWLTRTHRRGFRIWLPHALLRPAVATCYWLARRIFGPNLKLPSELVPARFAQGYRPLRYSTRRLREVLGWHPPLDLETCLERSFRPTGE